MEVTAEDHGIFKTPELKAERVLPKPDDNLDKDSAVECTSVKIEVNSSKKNTLPKREKKVSHSTLSYIEPEWGGNPPSGYCFEILKDGIILTDVLVNTSTFLFGRLPNCNIVLEHPSASRFHAVVQYCPGDKIHPRGFYLYDLGSTHGTFMNKEQIQPKVYCQIKVGHVIWFGGSSRKFIFKGPDDCDDDDESKVEEPRVKEKEVCNWGMSEDAEEEDDLMENPYALSTINEDLYLDDPKKSLRGWFDREGYDLEYIVEEKGFRTFSCKVQLPIDTMDGDVLYAEASVTGKKKEAVVACALEACRILNRRGLFRQARHESKKKKKKNWEDDDYYESDEDTFLDRTGSIEKKREIRKKLVSKPEVETHQSLKIKLEKVIQNINEIENKLQSGTADIEMQSRDEESDSLEIYMSQIESTSNETVDKFTKSKLRLELSSFQQERVRLEKMVNITKPTLLPPLVKAFPIIGKRPVKKFVLPPAKKVHVNVQSLNEKGEEEDEEDEEEQKGKVLDVGYDGSLKVNDATVSKQNENPVLQKYEEKTPVVVGKTDKVAEVKDTFLNKNECVTENKPSVAPKKMNIHQNRDSMEGEQRFTEKRKKEIDIYKENSLNYSMWTPPDNQTGDGKTHLNTKFGY